MSDTTHAPSRGTEPNGPRRYALAGYRWLLLAFSGELPVSARG